MSKTGNETLTMAAHFMARGGSESMREVELSDAFNKQMNNVLSKVRTKSLAIFYDETWGLLFFNVDRDSKYVLKYGESSGGKTLNEAFKLLLQRRGIEEKVVAPDFLDNIGEVIKANSLRVNLNNPYGESLDYYGAFKNLIVNPRISSPSARGICG